MRLLIILSFGCAAVCLGCGSRTSDQPAPSGGPIALDPTKLGTSTPVPPTNALPPGSIRLQVLPSIGKKYVFETTLNEDGKYTKFTTSLEAIEELKDGVRARLQSGRLSAEVDATRTGEVTYRSLKSSDGTKSLLQLIGVGTAYGVLGFRFPNDPIGKDSVWQDFLDTKHWLTLISGRPSKPNPGYGVPATWKLASIETVGGAKVAIIDYSYQGDIELPDGKLTVTVGGTAQIDTSDGLPRLIDISTETKQTVGGKAVVRSYTSETRRTN